MSSTAKQNTALLETEPGSQAAPTGPRRFTLVERLEILAASVLGYLTILLVGLSLRWEMFGRENYEAARALGGSLIFTFWHREIFSAIWQWRSRGIVVMVSQNFDGEYIARIIRGHGYGAARGSSSRGAARVLVELIRSLRKGIDAAITPDGPRGPRFMAKPGVVQLAKSSGAAILCFHIRPERSWSLHKSWDQTEIPKPFSPTAIFIAPPILVPTDAREVDLERKLEEVQSTLDGLAKQGVEWMQSRSERN